MDTGPHKTRQQFINIIMVLLWTVLWVKIGIIQFVRHESLYVRALDQHTESVTLSAHRGFILDRNGIRLAESVPSATYSIRPEEIKNLDKTAYAISAAMGMSLKSVKKILTSNKTFIYLVRQADMSLSEELDNISVGGLNKLSEFKRYYPHGPVGAQVLGYTDIDGRGIEGCEFYADKELSGRDGLSKVFKDANQRAVQSLDEPEIEPHNGLDVVLTIDFRIQEITDEAIEECINSTKARWGGVLVLNTGTGEILAMSNAPRFNPNDTAYFDPKSFDPNNRRNRLVTDMIEPGSTFKIVTFVEALESGFIHEDELIDCENGKLKIGRNTINDTHKLSIVPVTDVFSHSSNIGTIKIAEKIGKQKLYERARLMGFGTVTGIDFPNETAGLLPNPRKWSKLSLPTISFGQGVAVSSLQIAGAYAAVANGGLLLRPHLIKEVISEDGRPGCKVDKQIIRRVMSEQTAERILALLHEVIESGTGQSAALPNVRIAGKTGTAQRIKENGKGYEPNKYISSFVGFVSDRDPKILCLVIIDSPEGLYYGSQVAAPVFKKIMNRIFNMGNGPWSPMIAKTGKEHHSKKNTLPSLKGMNVRTAVNKLRKLGFNSSVVGDSTVVVKQIPFAGAALNESSDIILYSDTIIAEKNNQIKMPDLKGKTIREAVQDLVHTNLEVTVNGSGIVYEQEPFAGVLVDHGTKCIIECKKR